MPHNDFKHLKQNQVEMRHVSTIGISWILACQSYCFTKFIQVGIHESYFQKNPVLGRPLNQTGRKKKYFNNLQLHHNPKVSSGNRSDKRIEFFGTGFIIIYAWLNFKYFTNLIHCEIRVSVTFGYITIPNSIPCFIKTTCGLNSERFVIPTKKVTLCYINRWLPKDTKRHIFHQTRKSWNETKVNTSNQFHVRCFNFLTLHYVPNFKSLVRRLYMHYTAISYSIFFQQKINVKQLDPAEDPRFADCDSMVRIWNLAACVQQTKRERESHVSMYSY